MRSRAVVAALAVLSFGSIAAAQVPSIGSITPQAVAPGQTVDLTINGGNLKGATQLVTSFPSQAVLSPDVKDNGTNPAQVVFRVTLPPDAGPGVHAVRVQTPGGISPLKLIVVDDAQSVAQTGANGAFATPQVVTPPVAIDGAVPALNRHFYKMTLPAGQKVSIEVLARRMGSALDPMIRVLDAQGRELTYNDDAAGLMGDSQLSFTPAAAGDYIVEIRDIRWQGGAYRLRIGDFPLVSVPYPMAAKRGADASLSFAGLDIDGIAPIAVKVPTDPSQSAVTVGVKRAGGRTSGMASLSLSDTDEALEVEPNDTQDKATRVALGAGLNGRFEKPGDADRFIFTAKANDKFTFRAVTRQQGSPTDVTLKLLKADGSQLAEVEDTGTEDAVLNGAFPADGDYVLLVEELVKRGGPQYAYRIAVAPTPPPGFSIAATADALNIAAGGTASIPVTVTRTGYAGAIQVAAVDLPPGVVSSPTVIGPNLGGAILTVKSNPDAVQGKPFPIRIVGTAKVGAADVQSIATIDVAIKAANSAMPFSPEVLSRNVALAVGPAPQFTVRAEPAEAVFGQNLATSLKIIVTRQPTFDEDITLALVPFIAGQPPVPAGITPTVKPIPKGANEIDLAITGAANAPLGEFTGVLVATLKKGNDTHTQTVPGIILKVQAPYALKGEAVEGKVAKGGMLKIKVKAERNPAYKGPINLTFQNLPKGVTAAAAMIPADQNEAEAVLTAAADAAPGAAANVTIKGDGMGVGNAAITATSPAVAFTVE